MTSALSEKLEAAACIDSQSLPKLSQKCLWDSLLVTSQLALSFSSGLERPSNKAVVQRPNIRMPSNSWEALAD